MRVKRVLSTVLCVALLFSSIVTLVPQKASAATTQTESRNLKQAAITAIDAMPQLPSQAKIIDWKYRGLALDNFLFDWNWQATSGRKFATIFEDSQYGGFMMPAFYGETRPVDNLAKQESITLMGAMLGGSLLGSRKDILNPKGKNGELYLDSAKKYFWGQDGTFTNFPNGSNDSTVYNDLWYLLISNQNFFRLASLYPNWDVKNIQKSVANKMCDMVDKLGGENCNFNVQAFNFNTMEAKQPGWRQPDAAAGTASILYYSYKIFNDSKYLTYAKYCMDYLDKLNENPYYENMLIDASYVATMMNAEEGTHYNAAKYLQWITGTDSVARNWGGVNYTQDGKGVSGLTGEARGDRQYAFFFNSVYPLTSILPTAKYDPSYAKAAGKWAYNIVNSARYFLPSEWSAENQSNPEFKGKPEENILAYEGFKKYSQPGQDGPNVINNVHFMGTGDAMMNATSGWNAGTTVTNLGVYGSVYTEFLGALVEKTNVENILKLDCNKTDYYQNNMYPTYLYYNPYNESKMIDIDLDQPCDLFDSATGTYLAKNVSGKQSFKILANSARVLVLAPTNSTEQVANNTTTIDGKLVAYSDAEVLPAPGDKPVSSIQVTGADNITGKGQQTQFAAKILPTDAEDGRVIWSVVNTDGTETSKAVIEQNGLLTAVKNGEVKVVATAVDGTGVQGEKAVSITNQTLPSLSYGKNVVVSSQQNSFGGNLVVDGNTSTRWIANSNEVNPWIYVDLGAKASIESVILNWEAARSPQYRLEVSNDKTNWTLVKEVSDSGNSAAIVSIKPDTPTIARYVRVYTEKRSNWGASMYEFEVYGKFNIQQQVTNIEVTSASPSNEITTKNRTLQMHAGISPENATDQRVEWYFYGTDGKETDIAEITSTGLVKPLKNGTVQVVAKSVDGSGVSGSTLVKISGQDMVNLCIGKSASASQSESANPPKNAVDGNYNTRWASGSTDGSANYTIDLGSQNNVDKVVLTWEAAYALKYKIQGSTDGNTFIDFYVNNNGQGGTEELNFDLAKVHYLRIQGVQNQTDLGYSFWELEAYGEKTPAQVASEITVLNTPAKGATHITLPVMDGYDITIKSSSNKEVIALDGTITPPVNNTEVKLVLSVSKGGVTADTKELTVTVPGVKGPQPSVDKTELLAKLKEAKVIEAEGYTIDSYKTLTNTIAAAQTVANDQTATQAQVDDSLTNLQAAIDGLKAIAGETDKSSLLILYNTNKGRREGNYTDSSWQAFITALNSAKSILDNIDATQLEIDAAKSALTDAANGLKNRPSSSGGSTSTTPVTPLTPSTITTTTNASGGMVVAVSTKPDTTPVVTGNRSSVTVTIPTDVASIIASATAEKAAEVKIAAPTASLVEQLKNASVKNVDLTIQVPLAVANNTNENAKIYITAEQAVLQAAKDAQKDVTMKVTDVQTGAVAYSWTFIGNDLKNSAAPVTGIDLAITVESVKNNAAISAATVRNSSDQKSSGLIVKFGNNGLLPAPAIVRVYVGNQEDCTPNSKVYLYYYNGMINVLEQMPQSEYTVDALGYITFSIAHCSNYVLLPKSATNPYPVKSDTTFAVGVRVGKTYTFGITVSGNAVPSIGVGNSKVFESAIKHQGNKYYVTVKAVGTPGAMTALYSTLPGQKSTVLCYLAVAK